MGQQDISDVTIEHGDPSHHGTDPRTPNVLFAVRFDLLSVLEPLDVGVRVVRLHLHDDLVLLEVVHRLQLLLEAHRTVCSGKVEG